MKAIALAIVTALAAQAPPTFRSATDLVEVDVVVHDRNGAFVDDLAADDFVVEDNGVRQRVDQLYLHLQARAAWVDASGTPRSIEAAAAPAASHRTVVVVFDSDHLTTSGFKRTQQAALALFDKHFVDGVDMGGIVVDGRLVNDRLTSVRAELVDAVNRAKPTFTKNARVLDERQFPRMNEIEAIRIRVNLDREVRAEVIRRAMEDAPTAR